MIAACVLVILVALSDAIIYVDPPLPDQISSIQTELGCPANGLARLWTLRTRLLRAVQMMTKGARGYLLNRWAATNCE